MAYVFDIVLVVIIAIFVILSAKKGFLSASKNIITLLLTVTLLASMQGVMLEALQSSAVSDGIREIVSKNVTKTYEKEELPEEADTTDTKQAVVICRAMALPDFMTNSIEDSIRQMSEIKNNVMEVITDSITLMILRIIAMLLLFVLVRILVFLAVKILESLFGLPVLRTINKTLGAVIGILNSLLVIYVICGAISIFTPIDQLSGVQQVMDKTLLVQYFYNNNLLLSWLV